MAYGENVATAVRIDGEVFARDEDGNLRGPLVAPAFGRAGKSPGTARSDPGACP